MPKEAPPLRFVSLERPVNDISVPGRTGQADSGAHRPIPIRLAEVVRRYHALTCSTPQWGVYEGIFATLRSFISNATLDIRIFILPLAMAFNPLITRIL